VRNIHRRRGLLLGAHLLRHHAVTDSSRVVVGCQQTTLVPLALPNRSGVGEPETTTSWTASSLSSHQVGASERRSNHTLHSRSPPCARQIVLSSDSLQLDAREATGAGTPNVRHGWGAGSRSISPDHIQPRGNGGKAPGQIAAI
jgi:hypothetical protein